MKATLISATTIACLASVLIADVVRAFPVPSATNDEDIVKLVTRRDQAFVEPPTIRVREEHGVPSFLFVLRSIDVPILEDIRARSGGANPVVLPQVPSTFNVALTLNPNLEPEVHDYDNLPQVKYFKLPPPPDDHTVLLSGPEPSHRVDAKRGREKMGGNLKRHLLTLLRNTHDPETLTVDQVKHARKRVMQLWVLITERDFILLGSQPYNQTLKGLLVARRDAADGVEHGGYSEEEQKVAEECVKYYDAIERAYGQTQRVRSASAQYALHASNMFNIESRFDGNYDWLRGQTQTSTPRQA